MRPRHVAARDASSEPPHRAGSLARSLRHLPPDSLHHHNKAQAHSMILPRFDRGLPVSADRRASEPASARAREAAGPGSGRASPRTGFMPLGRLQDFATSQTKNISNARRKERKKKTEGKKRCTTNHPTTRFAS